MKPGVLSQDYLPIFAGLRMPISALRYLETVTLFLRHRALISTSYSQR